MSSCHRDWHDATMLHQVSAQCSTAGVACLGQCVRQKVPAGCSIMQVLMCSHTLGPQPLLGSCQEGLQLVVQAQTPQLVDDM